MKSNLDFHREQTIVAQATPPGRGGVAIVRVSGPLVKDIAVNLLKKMPLPRMATLASFFEEEEIIDTGIAVFFPSPRSFTGEDVLELQGHGGPVIVEWLIQRIQALGARLAHPGEFSERAFLNDKIDLLQAEAVSDLIASQSRAAAKAAMKTLQGEFSRKIQQIVEELIHLRMYIEASIDFSEEDIELMGEGKVIEQYHSILEKILTLLKHAQEGYRLREGLKVVMAGPPNAGKSTLMNALSGSDVSIVTSIPGTTRDVLREQILLNGISLNLSDTAGIRSTEDEIEREGILRSQREIESSDHLFWIVDCAQAPTQMEALKKLLEDRENPPSVTIIKNKCDVTKELPSRSDWEGFPVITLSAKCDLGIQDLRVYIKDQLIPKTEVEEVFIARRRHLDALQHSQEILMKGLQHIESRVFSLELIAEDLKIVQNHLGEITGEFTTDDLLGKIFSSFCIGK